MAAGKWKYGAMLLEPFCVTLQFDDVWNSYAMTHV